MITFIAYGLCLLLLEEAQWLQRAGEGRFELYGKACSKIRVAERTASLNWQWGGYIAGSNSAPLSLIAEQSASDSDDPKCRA